VINDKDVRLRELAAMGPRAMDGQKAILKEYFRDLGWEAPRVLKEMDASTDFYYDMVAQVKMDKWSKGRVVLMGDAGYCASPISGMVRSLSAPTCLFFNPCSQRANPVHFRAPRLL